MFKKISCCIFVAFLTSCTLMKGAVPIGEMYKDGFLFTGARPAPKSERKCIRLTQNYELKGAQHKVIFPAGLYRGEDKNRTGTFYYAPSQLKTDEFLFNTHRGGIYLSNQGKEASSFIVTGDFNRPVRQFRLPQELFKYLQMNVHC